MGSARAARVARREETPDPSGLETRMTRRAVALAEPAAQDARARYALGALLDPLGLRLAEAGEAGAVTLTADVAGADPARSDPAGVQRAGAGPQRGQTAGAETAGGETACGETAAAIPIRRGLLDDAFAALTLAAEAGA